MAERIKMMSGGGIANPNNAQRPAPAPKKRLSAIDGNQILFNPLKKIEEGNKDNKDNKAKIDNNKPAGSGNKFNQMKMMLEKRGGPRMGPRPSAQFIGMPKFGNLGQNNNDKGLDIIEEKSDKLKEGYNPVDDLEKKLENVVIKKDKKKKKKPIFEE